MIVVRGEGEDDRKFIGSAIRFDDRGFGFVLDGNIPAFGIPECDAMEWERVFIGLLAHSLLT